MEFDADARRNIAERELLLPCRVELRQVCRIREQKCRSTEFGEKHIEVPLASNERLIRSEEHTSELQSLMRISYAVFCLKKKNMRNIKRPTPVNNNKTKR